MDEIAHKFRRVFGIGGSIGITLPPEAGFADGDGATWHIEDGKLFLCKATVRSTDIRYTQVDRIRRKDALLEQIKNSDELIDENVLLARFAIDNEISLRTTLDYRDELLADGLIRRVEDTLQVI